MQSSDSPYKVLFLDPGLFEETVCLVAPELAATLDFSTATALDKEHLTAQTRTRLQDQLRRVELKEGLLKDGRRQYVLVLLEFQSRHDPDMAWRMKEYLHLVESDLREAGTLEREGALPPMLSIVVHNGEGHWRAATVCLGPLVGDGPPARIPMYATVDLQLLARGPDAQGRALAPGSRLATLAEVERRGPGRCRGCCEGRSSVTAARIPRRCDAGCICGSRRRSRAGAWRRNCLRWPSSSGCSHRDEEGT